MSQALVAGAVVKPIQDRELVCISVRMVNPSPVAVTVYKGRQLHSHIAVAVHGLVDNRVGGISARKREMLYNCGRTVTTCQRRNVRKC